MVGQGFGKRRRNGVGDKKRKKDGRKIKENGREMCRAKGGSSQG